MALATGLLVLLALGGVTMLIVAARVVWALMQDRKPPPG